ERGTRYMPKRLCGYLIRTLLARGASHKSTSYLADRRKCQSQGTRFAVHRRSTSFGAPSPSPRPAAIAASRELQRDVQWANPIHPNEWRRQAQPLSFVTGRRLSRSFRPNRGRSTNPASSSSMASTSTTEADQRAAAPSTPQAATESHANTKIKQRDQDARRTHLA
ncbi:hypothetical protein ACLOJK_034461, partial [Asimina triloba]